MLRRTLYALTSVAVLYTATKLEIGAPSVTYPSEILQDLLDNSQAHPRSEDWGISYLAERDRQWGNVAPALRQLEGAHPAVAAGQINALSYLPGYGRQLSPRERRAIVELAGTWPRTFEPLPGSGNAATTREELVAPLRNSDALRGVFEKYERPRESYVAEGPRQITD